MKIPSAQLKGLLVFSWWTKGDREKLETLATIRVSEQPACHGQYFPFVTWGSLLLGDESLVFYCLCPFTLSWDEPVKNKANLENDLIRVKFQEGLRITLTWSVHLKPEISLGELGSDYNEFGFHLT